MLMLNKEVNINILGFTYNLKQVTKALFGCMVLWFVVFGVCRVLTII